MSSGHRCPDADSKGCVVVAAAQLAALTVGEVLQHPVLPAPT